MMPARQISSGDSIDPTDVEACHAFHDVLVCDAATLVRHPFVPSGVDDSLTSRPGGIRSIGEPPKKLRGEMTVEEVAAQSQSFVEPLKVTVK